MEAALCNPNLIPAPRVDPENRIVELDIPDGENWTENGDHDWNRIPPEDLLVNDKKTDTEVALKLTRRDVDALYQIIEVLSLLDQDRTNPG